MFNSSSKGSAARGRLPGADARYVVDDGFDDGDYKSVAGEEDELEADKAVGGV